MTDIEDAIDRLADEVESISETEGLDETEIVSRLNQELKDRGVFDKL